MKKLIEDLRSELSNMRSPLVTRTTYELKEQELENALIRIKKMEDIIAHIDDVVKDWRLEKVGNLRAISNIDEILHPFNPKMRSKK